MYPNKEEILASCNRGLDIILHYYPEADKCLQGKSHHFKMNSRNDEKTASSNMFYSKSSNKYIIKDFGSGKSFDCFALVMHEENCEFDEACKIICDMLGIAPEHKKQAIQPEFEKRKKQEGESVGDWIAEYRDFEAKDMKFLFADKVIKSRQNQYKKSGKEYNEEDAMQPLIAVLKKYNFHCLVSRSIVKADGNVTVIKATDAYPIFTREEDEWKKIIQPRAKEKKHRFAYHGNKPQNLLNGYKQLKRAYTDLQKPPEEIDKEEKDTTPDKLKKAILCSGERDALNVAACSPEYHVLWLNSETATLSEKAFKKIKSKVEDFYNLPDIDPTGLRQGHELALKFLDIKTIELPKWLYKRKDRFRGTPKKDVRDFLDIEYPKELHQLVDCAKPLRFWDMKLVEPKKGKPYYKYDINNIYLYNFLFKSGFFRFKSQREKEGFVHCHMQNNVVSTIKTSEIADYILKFVQQKEPANISLQNAIVRTPQLSENSLSKIGFHEPDFVDFTKDSQFFFFKNKTWQITKNGIEEHQPGTINRNVWKEDLIDHQVNATEAPFTISKDASGNWQVYIKDKDSDFLNFLINTCRMHWYQELEVEAGKLPEKKKEEYLANNKFSLAGELLDADAQQEQVDHFVNRVFMLGYLLHRYKNPSRPWAVWIMENSVDIEGESQGGSGKSIIMRAPEHMMNAEVEGLRDKKKMYQPHFLENVSEKTDLVAFNDCDQYMPFSFFYNYITDEFPVNAKFVSQYNIPYEKSPKLVFSSNYPPNDIDGSTLRRLIYSVTSDYYHTKNERVKRHQTERTPATEFGHNLFRDWDEVQWNKYFNLMAQCCAFYLTQDSKIQPPMGKVKRRSLENLIGETFLDWAESYFNIHDKENSQCDKLLVKEEVFEDFLKKTRSNMKVNSFTKKLNNYAELYQDHILLNPKEMQNNSGRIIRNKDSEGRILEKTKEMIYIQRHGNKLNDPTLGEIPLQTDEDDNEPF